MPLDRRSFIRNATLGALAGAVRPDRLLAARDPFSAAGPTRVRRVRGRVRSAGAPAPGAVVSDGFRAVAADVDGRFEIVANPAARWLSLSLPSGHRVPTGPRGIALLHRPLPLRGEADVAFDLEPVPALDSSRHAFLALADPQTQTAAEMARFHAETVPDARRTVADLQGPVFGVACGDILYDDLSLFPDYERAVRAVDIPFFQVVGNHDLDLDATTDEASTTTFQSRFGPARYSFNVGDIHYVVLDDVLWHGAGYIGYLDRAALDWLASDLRHVEPGGTVVVFVHIPVLGTGYLRAGDDAPAPSTSVTNREALYRILEPYRAHVVSGHTHESEHPRHGGLREHVCGAVCGAWWSGDICYDGTPNGYAVFEARGDELRWRYKATGRPADHQLRLYPPGSDPTAPDELVANVWFADEDWTVTWFEGGDRRGSMARRVGLDPLSVRQHAGPERPEHRPWVEPVPTGHLYYAPLDADARDVVVEARDPWGRTFSARL